MSKSIFIFFLISAALPAHAYVDPGTGSLAVQFVIGSIVAAGFLLKTYYYQAKRKFLKLFGRGTSDMQDPAQPAKDGPAKPE
jgi:hypothetical protein